MDKEPKPRSFEARRRQWLLEVDARIMAYRRRVKFYTRQGVLLEVAPGTFPAPTDGFIAAVEREAELNAQHSVEQLELNLAAGLALNGWTVIEKKNGIVELRGPVRETFTLPPGFRPKGMP